jgi:hypothetical protein
VSASVLPRSHDVRDQAAQGRIQLQSTSLQPLTSRDRHGHGVHREGLGRSVSEEDSHGTASVTDPSRVS